MSNAYINQVIFGNSKENVNDEYVRELMPLMLTDERMKRFQSNVEQSLQQQSQSLQQQSQSLQTGPYPIDFQSTENLVADRILPETKEVIFEKKSRFQPKKNSLFWSIYELEHPEEAFLGTKANAEVDHRLKVVASLKPTPKRLKETNSKLTIEQTQALLGSMLVAKEDKLDFCIAYAVYYNKPIMVVYEKTYRVFSPMVDVVLEEEDVILLYASKPDSSKFPIYTAEKNLTPDMIRTTVRTKIQGPLRSMTSYKTPELDELAAFFQVPIKFRENDISKEKRRKKEDVYNDIKVAIHNDMN